MEDADLIKMWNDIEVPAISQAEMREMIRPRNQPVLRRIRKQLIWESSFFLLFIISYYTWFDDGSKGFYMNLLMVTGFSLYVIHDLLVYRFFNRPQKGFSIPSMLRNYRNRVRNMAAITFVFRGTASFLLICFFSSSWKFDTATIWALRVIATMLVLQLAFNLQTWLRRWKHVIKVIVDYLPVNALMDDDDGPSQGLDKFSRR